MDFGNVYEVFQIGDRVEINDICYVYYGRKGTIIDIKETGPHTEPIYTIALDGAWTLDDDGRPHEIQVNASALAKIPRKNIEEETITAGVRLGNSQTKITVLTALFMKWRNRENLLKEVLMK